MTGDDQPIAWTRDHPDNPWQRDRSHIHRIVPPGSRNPCDCVHCQADNAENADNQQEDETP